MENKEKKKMKIVKGYNLIDLDLGLGGAVQTLFFKEHIIK